MPPPSVRTLVVPRLMFDLNPGYNDRTFLEVILKENLNAKRVHLVKHEDFNRVWREMSPKWLPFDSKRCRKLLEEVRESVTIGRTSCVMIH